MKTKSLFVGLAAISLLCQATLGFGADAQQTISLEEFNQQLHAVLHQGDTTQAIQLLTSVIQVNPTDVDLYLERGEIYALTGNCKAALADCNQAIAIDPTDCRGYETRADVENRFNDGRDSVRDATESIQIKPTAPAYVERAYAYVTKGLYTNSVTDCNSALQLMPNLPVAYFVRGEAESLNHQLNEAIADETTALSISPHSSPYIVRGFAWYWKGDYRKAAQDFAAATTAPHRSAGNLNLLAWFYATCPHDELRNAQKAVDCASEACDLTGWHNVKFIDTYAAACAEAGDFEAAAQWEAKCLSNKNLPAAAAKEISARLALFKARRAFRTPR